MTNTQTELLLTTDEMDQLADRVLILLSFKETDYQNLRFLMNLLGIRTVEDKQRIIKEMQMGLSVWSPLEGGILTGKYNEEIPERSQIAT